MFMRQGCFHAKVDQWESRLAVACYRTPPTTNGIPVHSCPWQGSALSALSCFCPCFGRVAQGGIRYRGKTTANGACHPPSPKGLVYACLDTYTIRRSAGFVG